jgi:hypothetical protein
MKRLLVLLILVLFTIGCSSVHQIGQIGEFEIWQVKTRDALTPNTVTVLTHNLEDGALTKIEGGTGRSGLGQLAGPSAAVGAAYFIGKGLGDSGDEINTETNIKQEGSSATSGSVSEATGGTSTAYGGTAYSDSLSGSISLSGANANANANASAVSESNSSGEGGGWIPPGLRR